MKITAVIHGDNDVSMKLEMQVRALTGSSANGVPVISNQEYQGSIRLRDGVAPLSCGQEKNYRTNVIPTRWQVYPAWRRSRD